MQAIFRVCEVLFFSFMALFMLGGVAIIATQFFGVVSLNGSTVLGVENWLAPVTFACATACAVCAFVLNYRPKPQSQEHHYSTED